MLRILLVRGQFHCSQKPSACTEYLNILPALKNRRGFLRSLVWFQPAHLRRVPVSSIGLTTPHLRRLHIGPRSCDKRTIHQNLRLISPLSRTEPYGASGKHSPSGVVYQVGRKASAFFGPRIEGPSFFSFPTALCSSVRTTYGRAAQK